ncbi:hypothetical protein PR048_014064 [Dryococelus australis]|uniref:Uncharacterized protein n=1 Tax=Dryococelus australis TaxID=614101 RepID=A0ABQ9HU24_9NEOP|nr:hypothetical protein PR048_014064 [Dryococelus australis]
MVLQDIDSVEKMRRAVWALFCHLLHRLQHAFCPEGEESCLQSAIMEYVRHKSPKKASIATHRIQMNA